MIKLRTHVSLKFYFGTVFLIITLATWFCFVVVSTRYRHFGIEIRGSKKWMSRVESSLIFLEARSPEDLCMVLQNVSLITESKDGKSSAPYRMVPREIKISTEAADAGVRWCLLSILHESFHRKQMSDYLYRTGERVPTDEGSIKEREIETLEYTIDFGRRARLEEDLILRIEATLEEFKK